MRVTFVGGALTGYVTSSALGAVQPPANLPAASRVLRVGVACGAGQQQHTGQQRRQADDQHSAERHFQSPSCLKRENGISPIVAEFPEDANGRRRAVAGTGRRDGPAAATRGSYPNPFPEARAGEGTV